MCVTMCCHESYFQEHFLQSDKTLVKEALVVFGLETIWQNISICLRSITKQFYCIVWKQERIWRKENEKQKKWQLTRKTSNYASNQSKKCKKKSVFLWPFISKDILYVRSKNEASAQNCGTDLASLFSQYWKYNFGRNLSWGLNLFIDSVQRL